MAKVQKIARQSRITEEQTNGNKPGRKKLSEKEKTPEARFVRVAGIRTAKALKLLKNLRSCSNDTVYSYTEEQAKAIIKALRSSVDRLESSLMNPHSTNGKKYINKVENFFSK
jgi:hypothetical protein